MHRVLIIEDETKTVTFLRRGLLEHGFAVEVATNGTDGLHLAMEHDFDCIVLDVMMPGLNGFNVLTALRASRSMPVIILSAQQGVDSRVRGLQLGADDYLVKPFSFTELLERVRALLRRATRADRDLRFVLGDLEIDLLGTKARRAGRLIQLTAKEFKLLSTFVQRRGATLSRAMLADVVWGINFETDTNIVDVAVRRLRNKIDTGHEVKLIHTVRGMGYRCDIETHARDSKDDE